MDADRRREHCRPTPRRDLADVAYDLHRLAALSERCDDTLLRLEEGRFGTVPYMQKDYTNRLVMSGARCRDVRWMSDCRL
jgi:hypothetical protein